MRIKKIFLGFVVLISFLAKAQNSKKEVLFTINNKPFYTDEFLRIHNKNINLVKDHSLQDLDQYLELYIGYKLKVEKANQLGLQNNTKYINELKNYRNQLAKNYTNESKVTKALVDQAYQRWLQEIKASHLLLLLDENAKPADTLKTYRKALELRNKILAGESFGKIAQTYSEDPSAKDNKGDLGYFSVFRMVYPFENAAYNTKVGQISMPVRTKFGYHLIYVTNTRQNRGDISVAHIMIAKPTDTTSNTAKNTINDIYAKLQQGDNFENLAIQFSEDKNSGPRGGILPQFSSGQLSSEAFEDACFGLQKPGDYSKPIATQFGWHIVKLIQKYPVKTQNELQQELENKIKQDERSRIITKALASNLSKKYTIKTNTKAYDMVQKDLSNAYYDNQWTIPEDLEKNTTDILKINDQLISISSFMAYLNDYKNTPKNIQSTQKIIEKSFQQFTDNQIIEYNNQNLEKQFPEFENIVQEYRDGLLLFDLMETEIWNKAKQDTIGLKNYYLANLTKYQWKNRANVITIASSKKQSIAQARKLLLKNKSIDQIKDKCNQNNTVNILAKQELLEENTSNLSKNISYNKLGVSPIYKEADTYLVNQVTELLAAGPKKLDEIKGKVINDYQQELEKNWVTNLRQEFKVEINTPVFEKTKNTIKQ